MLRASPISRTISRNFTRNLTQSHRQNTNEVLAYFDKGAGSARSKYRSFVLKAIDQGHRRDLTGGGLIRSTGGWTAVKAMRKAKNHMKSDERILGDGDFVSKILADAYESLERTYALKARGVDVDFIAERVG